LLLISVLCCPVCVLSAENPIPFAPVHFPSVENPFPPAPVRFPSVEIPFPFAPDHFPPVEIPFPFAPDHFPSVEIPFPFAPDHFPPVENAFPPTRVRFPSVENAFPPTRVRFPSVENAFPPARVRFPSVENAFPFAPVHFPFVGNPFPFARVHLPSVEIPFPSAPVRFPSGGNPIPSVTKVYNGPAIMRMVRYLLRSLDLLIVLGAAMAVRLYRLNEFPLGAFVDEIFTLNSSILLGEQPFNPFGHTLQISEPWGKDHPNLFLYLNLAVLKLFGVSYWSTKILSVIPGVLACAFVFLIARRLFDREVALAVGLLFAFAHWPVRLSRYGWDVSIMLATFAAALWLLIVAMQTERPRYALYSGAVAALSLYSYLGGRMVLLSLAVFFVFENARRSYRQAVAFAIGAVLVALPFLWYYVANPSALWARTSEVSVFKSAEPVRAILMNIVRHALMFHWMGGTFARDNFPGLPMLDPLTGLLFIIGLFLAIRKRDTLARLVFCTLLLNLAAGIFSVSQEGPPYVYRTAAVLIPVFVLVGMGLQLVRERIRTRGVMIATAATILLNIYLYFGLELKNLAAMRVMAYEPRLIGREIARDDQPVWLIAQDVLSQAEVKPIPGEKYANSNPAVLIPPAVRKLAIIDFSGRYDLRKAVADNLAEPKDIYFVEPGKIPARGPAKIIFKSDNRELTQALNRPGVSLRDIPDSLGRLLFTVASLSP
jgi:hypothetical protein